MLIRPQDSGIRLRHFVQFSPQKSSTTDHSVSEKVSESYHQTVRYTVSHTPKRKVVSSSLAGGAKHRDLLLITVFFCFQSHYEMYNLGKMRIFLSHCAKTQQVQSELAAYKGMDMDDWFPLEWELSYRKCRTASITEYPALFLPEDCPALQDG